MPELFVGGICPLWGEEGLLGDLVGRSVDQGVADGGCASAKKRIFTQLLLENLTFQTDRDQVGENPLDKRKNYQIYREVK